MGRRETGETYEIRDGMCYLLDKHDKHTVTATTD
ncbi:ectoine synthase, partial [Nocardioides sp. NPDC006303]